jgi:hypothetical protein
MRPRLASKAAVRWASAGRCSVPRPGHHVDTPAAAALNDLPGRQRPGERLRGRPRPAAARAVRRRDVAARRRRESLACGCGRLWADRRRPACHLRQQVRLRRLIRPYPRRCLVRQPERTQALRRSLAGLRQRRQRRVLLRFRILLQVRPWRVTGLCRRRVCRAVPVLPHRLLLRVLRSPGQEVARREPRARAPPPPRGRLLPLLRLLWSCVRALVAVLLVFPPPVVQPAVLY